MQGFWLAARMPQSATPAPLPSPTGEGLGVRPGAKYKLLSTNYWRGFSLVSGFPKPGTSTVAQLHQIKSTALPVLRT